MSLYFTAFESILGSLKTCQVCSDQCNGLRVHYIHSAPFYEVTSWWGPYAGALCRTVNRAWQRWGRIAKGEVRGVDGWKGVDVSPSSMLRLVSQEETHCGRENHHLHTQYPEQICFIWVQQRFYTLFNGESWLVLQRRSTKYHLTRIEEPHLKLRKCYISFKTIGIKCLCSMHLWTYWLVWLGRNIIIFNE